MKLSIGIINRCVCCKSLEICLCMIFIPLYSSDIIKHNQESGMLHFYLCNLPTKITSPPLAFQHSGKRKKEKEKVLVTTELAIFIRKFLSSQLSISKSLSGNIKIIPTKVARNKSMPQQENSNAFEKCKLCSVLSILTTLGYCHSGSKLPNKPD